MNIGIPKEKKEHEYRVAATPSVLRPFIEQGHKVHVEKGAGEGSGYSDYAYKAVGVEIVEHTSALYDRSEMIWKVKEPTQEEFQYFHKGQLLFAYLHLAPDPLLTEFLMNQSITAFAYETVQDGRALPLLKPMSEIAGRLSVFAGIQCLERIQGGKGILACGVPGVKPAKVAIIGAGVVGSNAALIASRLGAEVTVLDIDAGSLGLVEREFGGRVKTIFSSRETIAEEVATSDVVIGAVLVPGAKAPSLVKEADVRAMRAGSVVVDVAIDQGGCIETSHPTKPSRPTYELHNVVHYCVTNMPGAVPRTSTESLSHAAAPYAMTLATKSWEQVYEQGGPLALGLNIADGQIMHAKVKSAFQEMKAAKPGVS
jgi:alanine dehydrogenase